MMKTTFQLFLGLCLLLAAGACREHSTPPVGSPLTALRSDVPVADDSRSTIFDFVDHLSQGSVSNARTALLLHDAGTHQILEDGWAPVAGDQGQNPPMVWAVGRTATLNLDLVSTGPSWIHFRCRPFTYDGCPEQYLTLAVSDWEAQPLLLQQTMADYSVEIPEGVLNDGENRVRLSFSYAEAPRDHIPHSRDHRTLAAAFESVAVSPDNETALDLPAGDEVAARPDAGLLIQEGTSEIEFTLRAPPGGLLRFGFAATDRDHPSENTRGEIWIRSEERDRVLVFSEEAVQGEPSFWTVDLDSVAGDTLEIAFRVAGPGSVTWRRPELLGTPGDLDVRSNVILIVVDTLRADFLSCYSGRANTPNIDRLAEDGVLFTRASSNIPITGPSHSTMFTSLLPMEHGVHNNTQPLSPEYRTLAEVLRDHYRNTVAFVSLGVLARNFGTAQGFDLYNDSFSGADWWKDAGEVNRDVFRWLDNRHGGPFFLWVHYSDPHEPYTPPDRSYPKAALTAAGKAVAPFEANGRIVTVPLVLRPGANEVRFDHTLQTPARPLAVRNLWVKSTAVAIRIPWINGFHDQPGNDRANSLRMPATITLDNPTGEALSVELKFLCQEMYTRETIQEPYTAEVEYVDRQIGELLQRLRGEGLLENTLVVFTADHGESMGDHGVFGHIEKLYDTMLRIPLIISFPGTIGPGQEIGSPASLLDLSPTILDLLGIEDREPRSGRSLLPLIHGREASASPPIVAETYRPEASADLRAILSGRFKYIVSAGGKEELYDLRADPGEWTNLAGVDQVSTDRLRALLEERIRAGQPAKPEPGGEPALGEEELLKLQALGYLQE